MNKAELIESMASESGLSKSDAKRALDTFTDATTKALRRATAPYWSDSDRSVSRSAPPGRGEIRAPETDL